MEKPYSKTDFIEWFMLAYTKKLGKYSDIPAEDDLKKLAGNVKLALDVAHSTDLNQTTYQPARHPRHPLPRSTKKW